LHSAYQNLLITLERYISAMNARALLNQAVKDAGGSLTNPRPDELVVIGANLRRSISIFVKEELREQAGKDIASVCGVTTDASRSATVEIRVEHDISKARSEARRLCEAFGAAGYTVQRITTVISELARNIVSYTPGGSIDLNVRTDRGPSRIQIVSRDQGKGIGNLQEIMSGAYRSRTGLGKGIAGCKKLADDFRIETGANGTRIEVEIRI
jgi:serine/threonine-protein kinase RsbT